MISSGLLKMKRLNVMRSMGTSLPSLEAMTETLTSEIEYEFYGKLNDFDDLVAKAKSTEYQEQYQLKKDRGSIRVRMSKVGDDTIYMLNSKMWEPGKLGDEEVEHEVSAGLFKHFKHIADSGMIKTRYVIPTGSQRLSDGTVTKLNWEIDVFQKANGERSEWVKIDLEVQEVLETLPDLPVELSNVVRNQKGSRTDKENRLLTNLFKSEFLVGPGVNNVDQTTEPTTTTTTNISNEGIFTDAFKKIFKGKLEANPIKWYDGDEYKKNLKSLLALESLIKSSEIELTDKPVSSKLAALFQVGKRPLRGTTIKDLVPAIKTHRKVLMNYLDMLKRYDAVIESESKTLSKITELSTVDIAASIATLTTAKAKTLSMFNRQVDMLGACSLITKDGTLTELTWPTTAKVNTINNKEELLEAVELLKSIYKNEQELPYYVSYDVVYGSYEDYPELWANMEDLKGYDEWSSLVYFQSVGAQLDDALNVSASISDLLLEYILTSFNISTDTPAQ